MTLGDVHLIRADARDLPLEDDSVDLIVTSPPYFGLRSYQDGGAHYDGQIGAEPTPGEFVDALLEVTREMVRVLKPSGSIFVNLGDKYARNGGGGAGSSDGVLGRGPRPASKTTTVRPKSLIGVPWRYAIRCIDDLDLILRAEMIWSKPNGLPEGGVRDRVSRKHEQFFHFTKSETYYSAIDYLREPHRTAEGAGARRGPSGGNRGTLTGRRHDDGAPVGNFTHAALGKLPGSVWDVVTEPLRVDPTLGIDHFAAFPTEWPRRLITGWTPTGICTVCEEGRRPIVQRTTTGHDNNSLAKEKGRLVAGSKIDSKEWTRMKAENPDRIIGETCACPDTSAPTRPAVVLDPFGGTGTTAAVARALGRTGISVDLSRDYLRLAEWRTTGAGFEKVLAKIARNTTAGNTSPRDVAPTLFGDEWTA